MSKYLITVPLAEGNVKETVWGTRYDIEHGVLSIIHARKTEDGVVGVYVKSYAPGSWLTIDEVTAHDQRLAHVGREIENRVKDAETVQADTASDAPAVN